MSNVVIIGGHGQIALLLARALEQRGHTAAGVIRNSAHQQDLVAVGSRPIMLDIETASVEELTSAFEGADTVVFAAGGGANSGPERKETVDHQGSVKSASAAVAAGVEYFVQISYLGADIPAEDNADPSWKAYQAAKSAADTSLKETSLAWTIVRPGRLIDIEASGNIEVGDHLTTGDTSRANTAELIAHIIDQRVGGHQVINVIEGSTPIVEALSS